MNFLLPMKMVERQFQLKSGIAEGTTPEDVWLQGIIAIWDWLNECTITSSVSPESVPPLAPITRDKALHARYREKRRAAAPSRQAPRGEDHNDR